MTDYSKLTKAELIKLLQDTERRLMNCIEDAKASAEQAGARDKNEYALDFVCLVIERTLKGLNGAMSANKKE